MECTVCGTDSGVVLREIDSDGTKEPVCYRCYYDFYATEGEKEMLKDQED